MLQGSKGDVAGLQTSVEAVDGRVTALPDVAGIEGRLGGLEEQFAAIPPASDLAPLQKQLDDMAAKIAAITPTDLGPVESEIEAIKTSLATTASAADLGALRQFVDDIAAKVASPPVVDLGPLQRQVAELKTQIDTLRSEAGGKAASADLESLAQALGDLDKRVAALPTGTDTGFAQQLAELKTELGTLKLQLAALPGAEEIAALRSDLAALKATPPSLKPPAVLEQVFFGVNSTVLSEPELSKLVALSDKLKADPQRLSIVGFTDSQGPAELNRSISLRRAAAVRRALVSYGVESSSLTSINGMGEDAPPIATGDNTEEAGNRVVQIYGYE